MHVKFLKHLLTPDQITNVQQIRQKQYKKRGKVCRSKQFVRALMWGVIWMGSMRRSRFAGPLRASPRWFSPLNTVASSSPFGAYLTRGLVLSSSPHWWALYFFTSAMYFDQASLLPGSTWQKGGKGDQLWESKVHTVYADTTANSTYFCVLFLLLCNHAGL